MFTKEIRPFLVLSVFIQAIFYIGLFYLSFTYFNHIVNSAISYLPVWLLWLSWIMWLLFGALFLFLMTFSFVFLSNLVLTPFNAFISEKIQKKEKFNIKTLEQQSVLYPKIILRALLRQLYFLFYYITRFFILALILLIPPINILAPILWFLFHAWIMTIQYVDYPSDNNQEPFFKMRQGLRENLGVSLGFGTAVLFLSMIPLLNLFVMPAAVCGGTLMWNKNRN